MNIIKNGGKIYIWGNLKSDSWKTASNTDQDSDKSTTQQYLTRHM